MMPRSRTFGSRPKYSWKLRREQLDERRMLAMVTVTNVLDEINGTTSSIIALNANPGVDGISFREAITATNNTIEDDTIEFDSAGASATPQTIKIASQLPTIMESISISGTGADRLAIDAGNRAVSCPKSKRALKRIGPTSAVSGIGLCLGKADEKPAFFMIRAISSVFR